MRINWEPFTWNSSSSDAIFEFATNHISFTQFKRQMKTHHQKEVRIEAKKFNTLTASQLKRRAQECSRRKGWY